MAPENNKSQASQSLQLTEDGKLSRYGERALSTVVNDTRDLGSAARVFDSKEPQAPFNILKDYRWTLSNKPPDLPYIELQEHRNTESSIMRSLAFYGGGAVENVVETGLNLLSQGATKMINGVAGLVGGSFGIKGNESQSLLAVYESIFPDNPTNLKYILPYFSKSYMELGTPEWPSLDDDISTTVKKATSGASQIAEGFSESSSKTRAIQEWGKKINAAAQGASAAQTIGNKLAYPIVNTIDRPKIFASHNKRGITIEFPLYNTFNENDWKQNVEFLNTFMSQNLFNKRDYITGYPPCYYRVYVPGQYFCFASQVSNIQVSNLGNVRMLELNGIKTAVPDGYQVAITMQELVVPSLNQFQSLFNGEARNKVKAS